MKWVTSTGGDMKARGYGATAARLTPDQKVGSSNLSGLICALVFFVVAHTPNKARANLQHGIEDCPGWAMLGSRQKLASGLVRSISGLVVEYIIAIDVTRARFPADALLD